MSARRVTYSKFERLVGSADSEPGYSSTYQIRMKRPLVALQAGGFHRFIQTARTDAAGIESIPGVMHTCYKATGDVSAATSCISDIEFCRRVRTLRYPKASRCKVFATSAVRTLTSVRATPGYEHQSK